MNNNFVKEVNEVFDLKNLETGRVPIKVREKKFGEFPTRVNHYCVKLPNADPQWGIFKDNQEIKDHVTELIEFTYGLGVQTSDRYIFITMDKGIVKPNNTLRDPGWHVDGFQGDEVPEKVAVGLQYLWSDSLPTLFYSEGFSIDGLDMSKHNVFNWLGRQVDEQYVLSSEANTVYAINAYQCHKPQVATVETPRKFLRVSFTKTPITSVKMTINEDVLYDYPIHTTTGNIPKHLV